MTSPLGDYVSCWVLLYCYQQLSRPRDRFLIERAKIALELGEICIEWVRVLHSD
jgi:hypothetical protein